ncbi:hypothetical protein PV326_001853, partial [Microctonus aethiopoides]
TFKNLSTSIKQELNNCKQNYNENVSDFFQRIEILNSRALSAAQQYTKNASDLPGKIQTINEITLNRFIYHSTPNISQMLRWKDFDNLNSAYTAALTEERALNINKKFYTGAGASLIKANKLTPQTFFNKNDKLILHGLNPNNPVETVGSCNLPLEIDDSTIFCKFHILNQATNVPYDGLIGKDFSQTNSAIINYESQTMKFKSLRNPIILFTDENDHNTESKTLLKARSHTFIEVNVINPEIKE